MKNLISVIVPVYKTEQYLKKCLESILNQTYSNLEIILVDDGSPDTCPQICDEYAVKDERIRVIHQENAGVSVARNTGLDAATGKYISFVDPDDWLEPDMYKVLLEHILTDDVDMVACGYFLDTDNKSLPGNLSKAVLGIQDTDGAMKNIIYQKTFKGYLWNKLFNRKKIVESNIRFQAGVIIMQDLLFCANLFSALKRFKFISDPLYHYVQREGSSVSRISKSEQRTDCAIFVRKEVAKILSPKLVQAKKDMNLYAYLQAESFVFYNYSVSRKRNHRYDEILKTNKALYYSSSNFSVKEKLCVFIKSVLVSIRAPRSLCRLAIQFGRL